MFGKRFGASSMAAQNDRRETSRRPAATSHAVLDGQTVELIDMSQAGVRLATSRPPRVGILEIYERGRPVLKTAAVLCWSRHGEAGYAFRQNIGVHQVSEQEMRARGSGGSALRARLGL